MKARDKVNDVIFVIQDIRDVGYSPPENFLTRRGILQKQNTPSAKLKTATV